MNSKLQDSCDIGFALPGQLQQPFVGRVIWVYHRTTKPKEGHIGMISLCEPKLAVICMGHSCTGRYNSKLPAMQMVSEDQISKT